MKRLRNWWHYEFRYWYVQRNLEKLRMAVVWRLPRGLIYWCAIRMGAHATTGEYSGQIVPELTFFEALERWDCGH